MSSDRPSVLAGILAGGGPSPGDAKEPPGQRALSELMSLMYRPGKDLTMRTRLDRIQIGACLRAIVASRHVGYSPLEDAAFLLMELAPSESGLSRGEARDMARSIYEASTETGNAQGRDPALDG